MLANVGTTEQSSCIERRSSCSRNAPCRRPLLPSPYNILLSLHGEGLRRVYRVPCIRDWKQLDQYPTETLKGLFRPTAWHDDCFPAIYTYDAPPVEQRLARVFPKRVYLQDASERTFAV